ncbi:hypothetical protein ASPWEDRAFT_38670 [Aspergillus wentii DTO 134E9]|uniref:Condensation domain-containing protein n=1 Tax=Aspergillus wentii DTO 134E9 TaxID=1073089 RepID=A0A1L9RQ91_ASPWE|nr:uncharacterized protein ASPWEDRAFT_38670 [Aspergillus wentii DTO 134E9]KAI9928475.1 hypothetical protein MW887_002520 [Aspergillus wentii]OJJ37033.1 hypothetical protein ASPWEDRAFT_38670 [Aspergillus wentii DTO 134E9]
MEQRIETKSFIGAKPPTFEPITLSALDHLLSPIHLFAYFTFHVNRPSDAIPVLENGLSRLFDALPFLTGDIETLPHLNGKQNVMQMRPTDAVTLAESPMLRIVHHQTKASAVERDSAEHTDYVPIPIPMIAPDPSPVARFQANIMQDGVVLCMAFDHRVMDGLGVIAILESLAACCRGDAALTTMASQLQKKQQIASITSSTPFHDQEGFGTEPRIPVHPISRKFSLSADKISQLKKICNSLTPAGSNISLTNGDIAAAIISISVMRAIQEASPSLPKDATAKMNYIVDGRSILQPHLGRYIGNTLMPGRLSFSHDAMKRNALNDLADISLIYNVASSLRSEVQSISAEQICSLVSHINNLDDWGSFQGQFPDFLVSSLRAFPVYAWDWGHVLGKMANLDMPDPRLNGACWVMPAKAVPGSNKAPPYELRIVLEERIIECLRREPLFCWASDASQTNGSAKL